MMIFQRLIDELLNRKIERELVEQKHLLQELTTSLKNLKSMNAEMYDVIHELQCEQYHIREDLVPIRKKGEKIEKDVRRFSVNFYNVGKSVAGYPEKVFSLLTLKSVQGEKAFCRIGRDYDGGYVMLDDFGNSGIAYSFGINDDVSWDKDMANQGFELYMYDPTIEKLPESSEKFHFFKIGLAGPNSKMPFPVMTLADILEENKHADRQDMILKIDIEGAEWEAIASSEAVTLKKFRQIAIEMHDMNDPRFAELILRSLAKLNETHQAVHIHANNYCTGIMAGGRFLPDVLEVTYLNRDYYQFVEYKGTLPHRLDMPNDYECPELCIGKDFIE